MSNAVYININGRNKSVYLADNNYNWESVPEQRPWDVLIEIKPVVDGKITVNPIKTATIQSVKLPSNYTKNVYERPSNADRWFNNYWDKGGYNYNFSDIVISIKDTDGTIKSINGSDYVDFNHYVSKIGIIREEGAEKILDDGCLNGEEGDLSAGEYEIGYVAAGSNDIKNVICSNGEKATLSFKTLEEAKKSANEELTDTHNVKVNRNAFISSNGYNTNTGEINFIKINLPEKETTKIRVKRLLTSGSYAHDGECHVIYSDDSGTSTSDELVYDFESGSIEITPPEEKGGICYLGISVGYNAELCYGYSKKIIKAEIVQQPTKKQYTAGELGVWDEPTGMRIKLTYFDGTTSTIPANKVNNYYTGTYTDEEYELGYNTIDVYLCEQDETAPFFVTGKSNVGVGTYYYCVLDRTIKNDEIENNEWGYWKEAQIARTTQIQVVPIKAVGALEVGETVRYVPTKSGSSFERKYYAMNLEADKEYRFETSIGGSYIFNIEDYDGCNVNYFDGYDETLQLIGYRFKPRASGIYYFTTNYPYSFDVSLYEANGIKDFKILEPQNISESTWQFTDGSYTGYYDSLMPYVAPFGLSLEVEYDDEELHSEVTCRGNNYVGEWWQEGFEVEVYDGIEGNIVPHDNPPVKKDTVLYWKIVNKNISDEDYNKIPNSEKWIPFTAKPPVSIKPEKGSVANIDQNLYYADSEGRYLGSRASISLKGLVSGKTYIVNVEAAKSSDWEENAVSEQRVFSRNSIPEENGVYSGWDYSIPTSNGPIIFTAREGKDYFFEIGVMAKNGVNITIEELNEDTIPEDKDVVVTKTVEGDNIELTGFDIISFEYPETELDNNTVEDGVIATITLGDGEDVQTEIIDLKTAGENVCIVKSDKTTIASLDTLGSLSPGNYYKKFKVPHISKAKNTKTGKYENRDYINVYVPFSVVGVTKDYTIKFNANGGTGTMKNLVGKKNVNVKLTANAFKKKGYNFVGWSTVDPYRDFEPADDYRGHIVNEMNGTLYENADTVLNLSDDGTTVTLYAVWQKAVYYIDVRWNGASPKDLGVETWDVTRSFTYNPSEGIGLPFADYIDAPEGFEFAGWYYDSAYKSKVPTEEYEDIELQMIPAGTASNVNLYAKLTPAKYTIIFDKNDKEDETLATGSMAKQANISYGVDTALSANKYARKDAAFVGWAVEPDGDVIYANKATITIDDIIEKGAVADENKNITLYAVWQSEFNIAANMMYEIDEDVEAPAPDNFPTSYTYGTTTTLPTPIRAGYTFGGWYSDANFKTKIAKITNKMSGDITLYAKWTPIKFTVKFDGNGGYLKNKKNTAANIGVTYDSAAFIKESYMDVFARSGYTFIGFTDAEHKLEARAIEEGNVEEEILPEGMPLYKDGENLKNFSTKNKATVILYAVWQKCPYKITLDGIIADDKIVVVSEDGNISWSEESKAISYYYETNKTKTYIGGEIKALPEIRSTDSGLTFGGWYKEPNYKTKVTTTNGLVGDMTLYAKWIKSFDVVYNSNAPEGSTANGTMANLSMTQGTEKALSDNKFSVPGYAFMGWSPDKVYVYGETDGILYKNKEKICPPNVEGDTYTLYAVWANKFTINYHMEGGIGYADDNEYYYGYTKQLMVPSRSGYTFAGWYSDSNYKTKVSSITAKMSGNLDLYAKWTPSKYKVTFVANAPEGRKVTGKMSAQTLTYMLNKKLTKNAYKISGYTFKGWTTVPLGELSKGEAIPEHVQHYTDAEMVGNVGNGYYDTKTLYAVWEKNEYTVTCNLNGVAAYVSDEVSESVPVEAEYTEEKMAKNYSYAPVVKSGSGYRVLSTYTIDDTVIIKNIVEPYRPGYTFAGWYIDAKCRKAAKDVAVGKATNLVLYAKWVVK